MTPPFFPGPAFGWGFLLVLFAFLLTACVLDVRAWKLPKTLTVTLLPLGLLANAVRGGWLAALGLPVWKLTPDGVGTGILDGLLFALAGAAVGFALFNVLFATGTCGGGDVKLAVGLGAWIGPRLSLWLLAGTVLAVCGYLVARALVRLVRSPGGEPGERFLNYSVPVTVVLAALLPWAFRFDLHLAEKHNPTVAEATSRGP